VTWAASALDGLQAYLPASAAPTEDTKSVEVGLGERCVAVKTVTPPPEEL